MHVLATFDTRHNTMRGEYHIPVLVFNNRKYELSRAGYASRSGAQQEAEAALAAIERAVERLIRARSTLAIRVAKPKAHKRVPVNQQKGPLSPTLESL